VIAGGQGRRDDDKLARGVGGRLGDPFAFGAARPAMTASPDGSTFTMSNAGPGVGVLSPDAGTLAAGGVAGTAG
jgi:hypothetical protein